MWSCLHERQWWPRLLACAHKAAAAKVFACGRRSNPKPFSRRCLLFCLTARCMAKAAPVSKAPAPAKAATAAHSRGATAASAAAAPAAAGGLSPNGAPAAAGAAALAPAAAQAVAAQPSADAATAATAPTGALALVARGAASPAKKNAGQVPSGSPAAKPKPGAAERGREMVEAALAKLEAANLLPKPGDRPVARAGLQCFPEDWSPSADPVQFLGVIADVALLQPPVNAAPSGTGHLRFAQVACYPCLLPDVATALLCRRGRSCPQLRCGQLRRRSRSLLATGTRLAPSALSSPCSQSTASHTPSVGS